MFHRTVALVGPSPLEPVSGLFLGNASVAPTKDGKTSNKLRRQNQLPLLLAGPQLRRTESDCVWIWLATCFSVKTVGRVLDPSGTSTSLGRGEATSMEVGRRLHVTLIPIKAVPAGGKRHAAYPTDKVLAYDLEFTPTDPDLYFDGARLLDPTDVALGDWETPTFVIASERRTTATLLHASCRKLHGAGTDSIFQALRHVEDTAEGGRRPTNLLLTGDQIYADDVDAGVLDELRFLAVKLMGRNETLPGQRKKCALIDPGDRLFVLNPPDQPGEKQRTHGFTAGDVAKNHLIALGEFYGMYLLAWSPDVWAYCADANGNFESSNLQPNTHSLRKLLANISTYMIFDDHEITDDWNLTYEWLQNNASIPMTRRIVSNGLAAYAMMQAIGNDPRHLAELAKRVRQTPVLGPAGQGPEPKPGSDPTDIDHWHDFDVAMWSFDDWAYVAETRPRVIVLDTRTQRELEPALVPNRERVAGLLAPRAIERLVRHLGEVGGAESDPVLLVAPAPVIGFALEELQRSSANVDSVLHPLDPDADPEAWSFHPRSFVAFFDALADSGRTRFVFLSGDVHYGFLAVAQFSRRTSAGIEQINLVQMTSSATHNQPISTEWYLPDETAGVFVRQVLDRLNNDEGDVRIRQGWRSRVSGSKYHPSIAEPGSFVARALGRERPWDFELRWRYLPTGGHGVVTDNNIGLVTVALRGGWVSQRLKTAAGDAHFRQVRWNKIGKALGR